MDHPEDDMTLAYMVGFHERDDEISALKNRLAEVEQLLEDMLDQACTIPLSHDEALLDSHALNAYANAMRYLSRVGRFEIEREQGRRVFGRIVRGKK